MSNSDWQNSARLKSTDSSLAVTRESTSFSSCLGVTIGEDHYLLALITTALSTRLELMTMPAEWLRFLSWVDDGKRTLLADLFG